MAGYNLDRMRSNKKVKKEKSEPKYSHHEWMLLNKENK